MNRISILGTLIAATFVLGAVAVIGTQATYALPQPTHDPDVWVEQNNEINQKTEKQQKF